MSPKVFGVSIKDVSMNEALQFSSEPGVYVFANASSWIAFSEFDTVKKAFSRARAVFADGVGTVLAGWIQGQKILNRNPGPDFTHRALTLWANEPMGFVGGTESGVKALQQKYGIRNSVQYIPPFRSVTEQGALEDWNAFLKLAGEKKIQPKVIWVCLGCPKQELWADFVSKGATESSFFAVGAAFDFLTETKARAPLWMRSFGLEWLHRLLSEPSRLWRRYLIGNLKLAYYAFRFARSAT